MDYQNLYIIDQERKLVEKRYQQTHLENIVRFYANSFRREKRRK